MKTSIRYAFPLIWLVVGPSVLWQLLSVQYIQFDAVSVATMILASTGTIGCLFRAAIMRLVAGIAGVLLGFIQIYTLGIMSLFSGMEGWTFSVVYWAFTYSGPGAYAILVFEIGALILVCSAAAYIAAVELDSRKKIPHRDIESV